jgi:hypothetical protein
LQEIISTKNNKNIPIQNLVKNTKNKIRNIYIYILVTLDGGFFLSFLFAFFFFFQICKDIRLGTEDNYILFGFFPSNQVFESNPKFSHFSKPAVNSRGSHTGAEPP